MGCFELGFGHMQHKCLSHCAITLITLLLIIIEKMLEILEYSREMLFWPDEHLLGVLLRAGIPKMGCGEVDTI